MESQELDRTEQPALRAVPGPVVSASAGKKKIYRNVDHVLMKTITSQPTRRKPTAHRSLWITHFEDPWSVVEASEL